MIDPIAIVAIAETLPEMADRISLEVAPDEPTSTLRNLVWSESRWNPDAYSNGDRGLVQINRYYHPEVSDAQAYDPAFALAYAARSIASSTEDQFVVCNCYAYLKTRLGALPKTADMHPNTTPKIGAVAIFAYIDKRTGVRVWHGGLIEKIDASGFFMAETNFTKCLFDRRWVAWGDPHLRGFWVRDPQDL